MILTMTPPLSLPATKVHRYNYDHFIATLFTQSELREDLFTLYAFSAVLAQIGEVIRELLAGHIRLQWWRSMVERMDENDLLAPVYGHPITDALATVVRRYQLAIADLLALIDTHAEALDPQPMV